MDAVYPIFLHNLQDSLVVVVGGGVVGERKVRGLLTVGAQVRLISPLATPALQEYAHVGRIVWIERAFQTDDLHGALLVFAATDQRSVNQEVFAAARAQRILCNVADCAEEGDFHLPALHREGELTLAVGSRGRDIHAAKRVRDRFVEIVRAERNQSYVD